VFSYCLELEDVLNELIGPKSKWNGLAGSFSNHLFVRHAILDASKVIRSRLNRIITADDRLRLTTEVHLDAIDKLAKGLKSDGIGLLPLLANFIHLAALLLGYDWLTGEPNREIVYFQTLDQQLRDDMKRHPAGLTGRLEYSGQVKIVKDLHSEGLRVSQIARILNQTEHRIKDILVREGIINRKKNVKNT
jgi:hypothetical protein